MIAAPAFHFRHAVEFSRPTRRVDVLQYALRMLR